MENDDDLMAMLEETQQDFNKKLKLSENKEETKQPAKDLIAQLEEAHAKDGKNKTATEAKEKDPQTEEDFFKGFKEFTEKLGALGPDGAGITPEEMQKASELFKEMFKDDRDDQDDQQDKEPGQANPFLDGYQNLSNDAKKLGNQGMMPGFGDLNGMFQDEEFKQFFNQFTQGMFKDGDMPEGVDFSNPDSMMENLMSSFTGYLDENKDNPELKSTFDQMMNDIVSKDSMYPPMKLMKDEMPKFLEENCEKLDPKDLERYNGQLDVIEEICKKYESDDSANTESIVDSLYKLQQFGAPPQELIDKIHGSSASQFPGMGGFGGFGNLMGFPKEDK
mmetsp:Transcript_23759/g.27319  ORF Transcript_23759/g.27319 Transcript_23759/m.27319 type:complete len:334 (-) Transcript_23759:51-1052(-)